MSDSSGRLAPRAFRSFCHHASRKSGPRRIKRLSHWNFDPPRVGFACWITVYPIAGRSFVAFYLSRNESTRRPSPRRPDLPRAFAAFLWGKHDAGAAMTEPGPDERRLNIAGGIVRALAVCVLIYLLAYVIWTLAT
jgi:hypothetical protein